MNANKFSVEGFKYEERLVETINSLGLSGSVQTPAGSSSTAPDADININGQTYSIEAKMNSAAQMGGTSLRYNPEQKTFDIVSDCVDEDTVSLMQEALKPLVSDLDKFLSAVGAEKLPATVEKSKWKDAVSSGLLKPLNVKIKRTTKFIIDHYKNKGVDYIQIGNAGLFYLSENPAGLPIPQLDGEINIELRPGRSGSKKRKDGTEVAGAGIRVQGRLQFKGSSPYTLDDPQSITDMLNNI